MAVTCEATPVVPNGNLVPADQAAAKAMRSSIWKPRGCWVLAVQACAIAVPAQSAPSIENSPRSFVEGFYKWYLPRAQEIDAPAGEDIVLRLRRSALSPELAKLLQEDSAAQDRCGELVRLDFDPFLNSQDPGERYEVGAIHQSGQQFRANVYRDIAGKRNNKPEFIAEFVQKDGRWFFVNFHYPEGSNLLALLKTRPQCTVPRTAREK